MRIECKSIYKVKGASQMTQVILHGILAKEFRKSFSLAVKRPKEVFDAISCAHSNFRNRIVELSNQGVHFILLVDGKKMTSMEELSTILNNQKIDIVPLICGHGIAAIIPLVVKGIAAVGAFAAQNALLTSLVVSAAMMGVQMMLSPKPKMERPESVVNGAKQSFLFSSKANVAEQGIPVPVGYGRLRVGSAVIQSTIKSYPQGFEKEIALKSDGGQSFNNDRT
jgi:predicted phage tail protein